MVDASAWHPMWHIADVLSAVPGYTKSKQSSGGDDDDDGKEREKDFERRGDVVDADVDIDVDVESPRPKRAAPPPRLAQQGGRGRVESSTAAPGERRALALERVEGALTALTTVQER